MYVVTDQDGAWLSEVTEYRPSDSEAWQAWDTALLPDDQLPRGHYPRVVKLA